MLGRSLKKMQFLSARPLIKDFKNKQFQDESIGVYFLAYIALLGLAIISPYFGDTDEWDIATSILVAVGGFIGVLYLKKMNGDTFGEGYLNKFFALGWVITFRMLLLSIPAAFMFMSSVIVLIGNRKDDIAAGGFFFTLLWIVVYYYWLGRLFYWQVQTGLTGIGQTHTHYEKP